MHVCLFVYSDWFIIHSHDHNHWQQENDGKHGQKQEAKDHRPGRRNLPGLQGIVFVFFHIYFLLLTTILTTLCTGDGEGEDNADGGTTAPITSF